MKKVLLSGDRTSLEVKAGKKGTKLYGTTYKLYAAVGMAVVAGLAIVTLSTAIIFSIPVL